MILFLWYVVLILLFLYSLKSREGFSGGVRFIRIVNATQPVPTYIQIGELMAYDKSGTNVALGKPTSSSGEWSGLGPERAIDNNIEGWNFFHSTHPPKASDFWEIDLGKEYNLERIEYYNRPDCCQERIIGCSMYLLNKNKAMIEQFKFTNNDMKQSFLVSSKKKKKEAHPAVRDRTRWI